MIDLPIALAFLSASAPITAAIIKFMPKRGGSESNGKYVTYREFTAYVSHNSERLDDLKSDIKSLSSYVRSRI